MRSSRVRVAADEPANVSVAGASIPRTTVRNWGGRAGSRLAASVLQAVTVFALARYATPATFSDYALALTVTAGIGTVVGFGFSTRALRLAAEPDPEVLASAMMRVRVATSVVAMAVGWGILTLSGVGWSAACLGGLVSAGVDQVAEITQSIEVGTLQFRLSAVVLIVQRVLPLAGLGIAVVVGASPFDGVAAGAGLTALMCLLLSRRLVFSRTPVPRDLARQSRQYWLAALLAGAQQFDVAVVRLLGGPTLSATYAAVSRVASPLNIVTGSALSIFAPVLSAIPHGPRRDREARVLIRIAAVFSGLIVLASPLVAYLFVELLGSRYQGAVPLVFAFCVAAALSGVSQALQAVMIARGRIGIVAATAGLATVVLLSAVAVLSASQPSLLWAAPVAAQVAVLAAYGWAYRATRFREAIA